MIRVLIVDQVRLMCHVFAAVLQDETDIDVVGCATSPDEAMSYTLRTDVVLVSGSLPDQGTFELLQNALAVNPLIKVVVFGLNQSRESILRFIEAGASGYVLAEDSVDRLLDNIRAVHKDFAYISPEIAAALISRVAELRVRCERDGASISNGIELSPREREVLDLVRQGLSNREIADRLTIEVGTVKNHMHNVLRKLNVRSRHEAAQFA